MRPTPSEVQETMVAIMKRAGLHPALIHAHVKTGLLVGEDTPHTPAQRQEWMEAMEEWYAMHPEENDA